MAAEPAPAFQFYVRDWLADAKVRAMSNEARGVYIDLLAYFWLEGALPADQIQRIAGLTKRQMRRIWPQIAPCLTLDGDQVRQKRVEHEREVRRRFAQDKSENGRKGAKTRWHGHDFANGKPIANDSSSSSSSSSVQDQEQRAGARKRSPDPPNRKVLTRLAHEQPAGLEDEADRKDELKRDAIRYGLAFDGDSVAHALDGVDRHRRRQ